MQSTNSKGPNLTGKKVIEEADELYSTKHYEEAIKLYAQSLKIHLQQPDIPQNNPIIARAHQHIGHCQTTKLSRITEEF